MFQTGERFYDEALNLLRLAGHTSTIAPIYINHTFKQTVYFDTNKTLSTDAALSGLDITAINISHLFNLGNDLFESELQDKIGYYSVEIVSSLEDRSQAAYDIHRLLHPTFEESSTVMLFCHNDKFMLSIAKSDEDIVLSDWYDRYLDSGKVAEMIDISEFSFDSAADFICEFIYKIARDYYLHTTPTGLEIYDYLPVYQSYEILETWGKEKIKEFVDNLMNKSQAEYGYDYVAPCNISDVNYNRIYDELETLSLDLENDEEIPETLFDEDELFDDDNLEDEDDQIYLEDLDDNDLHGIPPEVINDPILLVKWLNNG